MRSCNYWSRIAEKLLHVDRRKREGYSFDEPYFSSSPCRTWIILKGVLEPAGTEGTFLGVGGISSGGVGRENPP